MQELDVNIAPADAQAAQRSRDKWNAIAKPIGSLGLLEDAVVKMAALTGSENIGISKRCVAVLCADNGVVAQGVTQSESDVTTIVANCIAQNISSVCKMCAPVGVDAIAYDFGMLTPASELGVRNRCIARGTADITQGPAMTRDQALAAVRAGIDVVAELKAEGYTLIATGEMGIGNTTTSTAMSCVLAGMTPEQLTGRGAGLSDAGLERKIWAVKRAISVNAPDANDVIGALSKVGGFDIAGMCGMFLGGAIHRVPVIVDGVISAIAAYCAAQLYPECSIAMLASHESSEPAAPVLLERMGLAPLIRAHMRLGEGTGAVCLVPLLDMALSIYNGSTFDDYGMDAYEVDLK